MRGEDDYFPVCAYAVANLSGATFWQPLRLLVLKKRMRRDSMAKPTDGLCAEHDNHYVADPDNAHIDTSRFGCWLEDEIAPKRKKADDWWPAIYEEIVRRLSTPPEKPDDDTLICRYLTPGNFVRFVGQTALHFAKATAFEDRSDCSLPDDYDHCVLEFLCRQGVSADPWLKYAQQMRAQWVVSCWTQLIHGHDDYPLWHRYAGGNLGVGITLRYQQLRNHLAHLYELRQLQNAAEVPISGRVEYTRSKKWTLRTPPFNKRRIFGSEREIRFAFHAQEAQQSGILVDIGGLKRCFGLRFSPDVPRDYVCSVREVWTKWGGMEDRYHIVDE